MTDCTPDIKNGTFLVTGSAGFIGFHVPRTLLSHGGRVIGLDNFNDYYPPALKHDRDLELRRHPDFISVAADLTDLPALEALFSAHRPRKICHLADKSVQYIIEGYDGAIYISEAVKGYVERYNPKDGSWENYGIVDDPGPPYYRYAYTLGGLGAMSMSPWGKTLGIW